VDGSWRESPSTPRVAASDLDARATEARCGHVGWLLAGARGYLVRSLADEPLGRVGGLSYGEDDRWPRALSLRPRGVRGLLWSRTARELPFSAVLAVSPARREVRVLTDGWPTAGVSPDGSGAASSSGVPR
jgi:hypothetical protein